MNYLENDHKIRFRKRKPLTTEREVLKRYPNIELFNMLWEKKEINTPLFILIGGYAGTGKSTVADALKRDIPHMNIVPTGILRSLIQRQIPQDEEPVLYENTYNLHLLCHHPAERQEIIELFERQRNFVSDTIPTIGTFVAQEHQHTILDGNHVHPGIASGLKNMGILPIEFYLEVPDPDLHRQMISGPTHNREILDDSQFATARTLHDFIIEEARTQLKPVFGIDNPVSQALELINSTLEPVVSGFRGNSASVENKL